MKYYFNEIGSYFGSIMRDELEDEYMSVSKFYVDTFNLNQWHIYGSSRLGVYNADLNLVNVYFHADTTGGDFDSVNVEHTYVASPNYNLFNLVRGAKRYELSNWLGNVNVVVTDKKIPVCYADTVHHYTADVISAQDYSPFGAPLPDRSYDLIRDQSHNIIHTDSFNSTTEDWVVASGTASLAQALGKMRVTINSSGASAREYFPTVRYNKYVYSVRIDTGNIAGIIVSVKDSASGTTLATQTVTVSGNYSLSFTAAGPSTYLYVTQTGTYSAGKIFFVDNVVVEEDLAFKSAYSFHFNGKEMDNEVKGAGNWQDYGMRPYDPRIGRPPSIDPITKQYPELSPYQFFNNNPIRNVDLDGAEGLPNEIFNAAAKAGKAVIQKATNYVVAKVVEISTDYAAKLIAEKIQEKTNPAVKQAIGMTGEFMFGVGPQERHFGPNAPITQDLMKSDLTAEARNKFYEINKDALAKGDFKAVKPISEVFKFNTGLVTEGVNTQQFVGSATYNITLATDNKTINYTITNETSKNSLMYHGMIPFVDATSHTRDENPVMGTTKQTYESSEPLTIPNK